MHNKLQNQKCQSFVEGELFKIRLSGESSDFAIIDIEDRKKVAPYVWWVTDGYASSGYYIGNRKIGRKWKPLRMHRIIMGCDDSTKKIDHINGNRLDNRKSNLRFCSNQQNSFNMSQSARKNKNSASRFKGVSYDKKRNAWTSAIMKDYSKHFLGRFDSEIQAANAYNAAAKKMFGSFANLNKFTEDEIRQLSLPMLPRVDKRRLRTALDSQTLSEIRRLRSNGMPYKKIASSLNIDKNTARNACIRSDYVANDRSLGMPKSGMPSNGLRKNWMRPSLAD
jgi:hypothetical protein